MISVAAAGATYTSLGGSYGTLPAAPLQPLMAAAMIYFLVNSLAVAAAFGLSTRRGVFRVWHDNFLWTISSYVVGAIAAGIAVELFHSAGQWWTALAFIPLGLTYRTYRIYLRRIADEQQRVAEWTQLHRDSTEVLARAIQAKDEGGSCHVERVQYYAAALARRLELPDLDRQAVEIAALLHDIGKLAVPEHILSKPGPLTSDERKKMQMHARDRCRNRQRGTVPVPRRPAHSQSSRALGRQGVSVRTARRTDSRWVREYCRSSIASTRSPPRVRTGPRCQRTRRSACSRKRLARHSIPAIVDAFTALVPQLTPPTNDGFSRRIRHSTDSLGRSPCDRSIGSGSVPMHLQRSRRQTARPTRCMKSRSRWAEA